DPPAGSAAVGHGGGAVELRALRRPADRRDADAADGLRELPRAPAIAAAGPDLPAAAHRRGPGGHPDRARPAHGDLAADADPRPDAVRLAVGNDRTAAGGAVAGLYQDGAQPAGGHAALGAVAGVAGIRDSGFGIRDSGFGKSVFAWVRPVERRDAFLRLFAVRGRDFSA